MTHKYFYCTDETEEKKSMPERFKLLTWIEMKCSVIMLSRMAIRNKRLSIKIPLAFPKQQRCMLG
ncbi:hypothetical protein ACQKFG_04660 [Peribacillus sp. NPDC076916]|uniref:hypothetical protein n=1 Tax=Peribacillus sp. NPDC076916 TaxID=3390608 RepID=UPI003CFE5187